MPARCFISLSFCSILVSAAAAFAADAEWPQWRGPNRDGVSKETGLLKTWPSQGPPLEWTAKGLGTGYSSVSISGGKIFTSSMSKCSSASAGIFGGLPVLP